MQEKKERMAGILGTIIFHALLVLFLLVIYLKAPIQSNLTEWGGVPVMFGNIADAYGDDEPYGGGGKVDYGAIASNEVDVAPMEAVNPTVTESSVGSNDTPIATQDFEETVVIDNTATDEKRRKDEKLAEERREAEQKRVQEEQRIAQEKLEAQKKAEKKEQIGNQMSGLFGKGTGSGSRGNTQGEGTQGVTTGNASFGKTSGVGGWGSFDLGGRSLGRAGLVRPNYTVDDYGTVVVDIVVNSQGNVVEANIGKGTNAVSDVLKREALNAARKTKFNVVSESANQKGNITYKFNLN